MAIEVSLLLTFSYKREIAHELMEQDCPLDQLHCRHHHLVFSAKGASGGTDHRGGYGWQNTSMAYGLPEVSELYHLLRFPGSRIASDKADGSLPESWRGQFDRVVSIEMLEAVGWVDFSSLSA